MIENNTNIYFAEALLKKESPDPGFQTRYEYIILEIQASDEDSAKKEAENYMQSYNYEYQGGVWIKQSFVRIICINPALEIVSGNVKEIVSVPFVDIESFEKWQNTDWMGD